MYFKNQNIFIWLLFNLIYTQQQEFNSNKLPSPEEIALYNRVKGAINIPNPYTDLFSLSEVCTGTSNGLSSTVYEYNKWNISYSNCKYLDGNLEITNFKIPNGKSIDDYDFSFLESITEITGYLLVFNSDIRYLPLKNLKIIRGWKLFKDKSIYIDSNPFLNYLDLQNLREIQNGSVIIQNNRELCHVSTIDWKDIFTKENDFESSITQANNRPPYMCDNCNKTCCHKSIENGFQVDKCHCWQKDICQNLSKSYCDARCEGRCFGPSIRECCHSHCAVGCTGPKKTDCLSCKKYRVQETNECVESCERIVNVNPSSGMIEPNVNGMYQYSIACVRECPKNWAIYSEYCVRVCPNNTFEQETVKSGNITIKECLPCTKYTCPNMCFLKDDERVNSLTIERFRDCEELSGNLIIIEAIDQNGFIENQLSEDDLDLLKNLRVITGFLQIQSHTFKSLDFLRNLEVIRGRSTFASTYSFVVVSQSLRTLGLKQLKKIENGEIVIKAERLCLTETINWDFITEAERTIYGENPDLDCEADGYVCDAMCDGCWSTENNMCQFCKTYKLNDACVDNCKNQTVNGQSLYLIDEENRVCDYCHVECRHGCTGPTDMDCNECSNAFIRVNKTNHRCLHSCPVTHYRNQTTNECLKCSTNCDSCLGPESILSENGCVTCSSGIVDGDDKYTILQCINNDVECETGFYPTFVPSAFKGHLLSGKRVCRKCHTECSECYADGSLNCLKCNRFNSSNGNCVSQCNRQAEYLNQTSKACLRCHSQCSVDGCYGTFNHECKECRSFKLDTKTALELMSRSNDSTPVKDYLRAESINIDLMDMNKVFCVSKCPPDFMHLNNEFTCVKDLPNRNVPFSLILVIVFIGLISITIISIVLLLRYKIEKDNKRRMDIYVNGYWSEDGDDRVANGNGDGNGDPLTTKVVKEANLTKLKLINMEELKKGQLLGKGAFGSVYEAIWYPVDERKFHLKVAIKELKNETTEEKSEELIDEAKIMATVSHPYCLRLIGICMAKPVTLVTPLVPYGSILNFYDKFKAKVNEKMLTIWCTQIAEGMNYLESREIVHRDLAARNVLVQSFTHVKITDFGLAKILNTSNTEPVAETNSLWPIKWLAPECIEKRLFTHKSDVWSFGVTCWEILTFGCKPFENIQIKDVYAYIKNGTRLAQPHCASIDVYMQLLKCWMEDPVTRPTFSKLENEFSRMCKDPKRYLSITPECFNEISATSMKPNLTHLLREFSRETQITQLTDSYYIDDGIADIESSEFSSNRNILPSVTTSAGYGSFSRSEDENYLNGSLSCNLSKSSRYCSDPLYKAQQQQQHAQPQLRINRRNQFNRSSKINSLSKVNENNDNVFFPPNYDDLDEERLLSTSGASTAFSSLSSTSNNQLFTNSQNELRNASSANDQSTNTADTKTRSSPSNPKPLNEQQITQQLCSANLLSVLKESPIYNKPTTSQPTQSQTVASPTVMASHNSKNFNSLTKHAFVDFISRKLNKD